MKSCGIRTVPLIYTNADDALMDSVQPEYTAEQNTELKLSYLSCGEPNEQVDIFGLNTFRYCTNTDNFTSSNMYKLQSSLIASQIPIIFTEYGCTPFYYNPSTSNVQGQRDWKETRVIYGMNDGVEQYWNNRQQKLDNLTVQMNNIFSGGVACMYSILYRVVGDIGKC